MKKVLLSLFLGVFCFACLGVVLAKEMVGTPIYGDVNSDGVINVTDLQCTAITSFWESNGAEGQPPTCLGTDTSVKADLDCNGEVNTLDISLISRMALSNGSLPSGIDANADGIPDACDTDMDSVYDLIDNCPSVANSTQLDDDNDGVGNACSISNANVELMPSSGNSNSISFTSSFSTCILEYEEAYIETATVAGAGLQLLPVPTFKVWGEANTEVTCPYNVVAMDDAAYNQAIGMQGELSYDNSQVALSGFSIPLSSFSNLEKTVDICENFTTTPGDLFQCVQEILLKPFIYLPTGHFIVFSDVGDKGIWGENGGGRFLISNMTDPDTPLTGAYLDPEGNVVGDPYVLSVKFLLLEDTDQEDPVKIIAKTVFMNSDVTGSFCEGDEQSCNISDNMFNVKFE